MEKQLDALWLVLNFLFPELRKLWAILNTYTPLGKFQKEGLNATRVTVEASTKISRYYRKEEALKTNVNDPGCFLA